MPKIIISAPFGNIQEGDCLQSDIVIGHGGMALNLRREI